MTEQPLSRAQQNIGFLVEYGNFLALWSTFDVMVEIILHAPTPAGARGSINRMRRARLRGQNAYANVAVEPRLNNAESVKLLKRAQALAERNSFAHGFFRTSRDDATYHLIKREVKETYEAKLRVLDFVKMGDHAAQFIEIFSTVQAHFQISDADVDAYTGPIEALALTRASKDKPRPERQSMFVKAKKK